MIGPLPTAKEQVRYVIVTIDYCTKWAEAEPLAKIKKEKTIHFVWKTIIRRFCIPHTIVFDNGQQFDNSKFREFYSSLGIINSFSSPAHIQANGQVETVNEIIKFHLKTRLENLRGA